MCKNRMLKDVNAWNVSTLITDSLSSGNAVKENANKKVERTKIYLREIMYEKDKLKALRTLYIILNLPSLHTFIHPKNPRIISSPFIRTNYLKSQTCHKYDIC